MYLAKPRLATDEGGEPHRDAHGTRVVREPVTVAIVGQPGWSRHIAGMLAGHAADFVAPSVFAGSRLRTLLAGRQRVDVLLRVGYRPGSPTARGRAFDALWWMIRRRHPEAAAVHYWLGTDVLNATTDGSRGRLRAAFRASASDVHLVTASWHLEELAALGISAEFAPLPYALTRRPVVPLPRRFTILTYVPQPRFTFYGGPQIFELAKRLPDVPVRVLGGATRPAAAPGNVDYPGWVREPGPLYDASTVVLRIVPHDGIGGTVLEGLAHARHVIYTYPFPHVRHVPYHDIDRLVQVVSELATQHARGALAPNLDGRDYVLREHDEQRLASDLASKVVGAIQAEGAQR